MLTKEQKSALSKLLEWVRSNEQCIALAGYAGTGKTTLLGELAKSIQSYFPGLKIHFITYTGKASTILAEKLTNSGISWENATCGTIHSLLYRYKGRVQDKILWSRKEDEEVDGDLIIIDEASMITNEIFNDLVSLGKKILFVGDPGQLPPVNGDIFEPLISTDIRLNSIHRQAWDNPIIRMATKVRNGEDLPYGVYDGMAGRFERGSNKAKDYVSIITKDLHCNTDKIGLSKMNNTRVHNNKNIRYKLDYKKDPMRNERIICLKNNKKCGLMNGFILPAEVVNDYSDNLYEMIFKEYGTFYCPKLSFNNQKPNEPIKTGEKVEQDKLMYFDFAYFITVHKAQGSEWGKVLLINERNPKETEEQHIKWLYTGITRAREKLIIVG